MEKMVDWVQDNIRRDPAPSILEVGSGNGALLFAVQESGYDARSICGVDYSEDAIKLARAIGASKGGDAGHITFEVCDALHEWPRLPEGVPLQAGREHAVWDLVLDKGTLDAIALADKEADGTVPASKYLARIAEMVKPGGYFLIVCECAIPARPRPLSDIVLIACNFTEEELKEKFATPQSGLQYQ